MVLFGIKTENKNDFIYLCDRVGQAEKYSNSPLAMTNTLIKLKTKPLGNNTLAILYSPLQFKWYWLGIISLYFALFVFSPRASFTYILGVILSSLLTLSFFLWQGSFLFNIIKIKLRKRGLKGKLEYVATDDIAELLLEQ